MMRTKTSDMCVITAVSLIGGNAAAQLHDKDMIIGLSGEPGDPDRRLITGLPGEGGVEWGRRVVRGLLGIEGFDNFTNDPGFDSPSGTFPPGVSISYTIEGPLKVWDGSDFDAIAPDRLVIRKFGEDRLTPLDGTSVEGVVFGESDGVGKFHHHVQFFFEDFLQPAVDGVWQLTLRLVPDSGFRPSEPLFIVFAQGAGVAERDAAIAYVESSLVAPAGCNPADLAAPFGVLNSSDVNAFVASFLSGVGEADLAAPIGIFNSSDINAFVGAFLGGCP